MNTQVQKNIQRVLVMATALVLTGAALNVFVLNTLGSFDAASVILALYVASWAFVLGDIGVILSALWFFMRGRVGLAQQASVRAGADGHRPIRLESEPVTKPCYAC
jgi:hypothetical protein